MNGNSLLSLKKMNNSKSRMTKRIHESYSTSYNDPWFYNQKNLTFQINSMRTSSYISRMNGLLSPSKTFVSINMPTESTFEDVRKKIVFMKGVIYYGYPELVVGKIKEIEKTLKKRKREEMRKKNYIIPCRERDIKTSERNKERKVFLKEAMKIKHIGI